MSEASQLQALEGKYEILEKLSEGGMGAVYKVRHRLLDSVRVIKVMRPHIAADDLFRARFVREAKLAIRLRHSNIAQVFDFTMGDDGAFYLVLEYIDGLDLHQLMKAIGTVPVSVALEVSHQSLGVIGYLHRKDIVHRDISPDNLLVTRDDDGELLVKLIDLGIAKVTLTEGNLTAAGTFLGKVRYSSPEQFRADEGADVGPSSDLYSFGIVLYELLTGVYPIKGSNLSAIITGHLMQEPLSFAESDPDGRVPEPLRAIVLRAIAKHPEDRFPSARAFRSELASLREAHPVSETEIHQIFEAPVLMTTKIPVMKPGSTQSHLDQNFVVEATPAHVAPTAVEADGGDQPAAVSDAAVAPADTPAVRASVDKQVRALLLGAEKLVEAQHGDEARLQLEAAKALAPDHPEVAKLERALDTIDLRFQARLEAATAEIGEAIDSENFDRAAGKLEAASGRFGSQPTLSELETALETARAGWQERQSRIVGILAATRELMAAAEWEDAAPMAREALILDPANQEAAAVVREAEVGLNRHRDAQRRAAELDKTVTTIAAHIDKEELDQAVRALALSRKVYGAEAGFDELEVRIDEVKARRVQRQVEAMRREGEDLLQNHTYGAAIDRFEKGLSFAPDDESLSDLLAAAREGMRLQKEAEQRQRAIDETALSVERLVLAGRLESAYRTIDGAISNIGEFELADALRTRVEHDIADREAAEKAVREALERAREAAAAKEFEVAAKHVGGAEKLVAEYPELGPPVEDAAREIREGAAAHRRTMGVEEAARSISSRLEAGGLERAERELTLALRLYGDEAELLDLRARLAEANRAIKVDRLVASAQAPGTSIDDALARLEEALELDPSNQQVERLKADLLATRRRQHEERRAQAIADALAPIDALIAEGALEKALVAIDAAVAELGDFPEARGLKHRLRRALVD